MPTSTGLRGGCRDSPTGNREWRDVGLRARVTAGCSGKPRPPSSSRDRLRSERSASAPSEENRSVPTAGRRTRPDDSELVGHRSQSADDGRRRPPAAWLLRWLGGAYRCVSESVPPRRGTDFDAPLTGSLSLYALRAPPVWPMSSPAAPGRLPAWPRTTDNGGRRPRGFCGGLAAPIDSHRGAFLRGAAWPLTRLLRDGRTLRQGVPSLGSSIVASPVRAISRPCAAQGALPRRHS